MTLKWSNICLWNSSIHSAFLYHEERQRTSGTQTHPHYSLSAIHTYPHMHTHTAVVRIVQYGKQWTELLQFVLSELQSVYQHLSTHAHSGAHTHENPTASLFTHSVFHKHTHTRRYKDVVVCWGQLLSQCCWTESVCLSERCCRPLSQLD